MTDPVLPYSGGNSYLANSTWIPYSRTYEDVMADRKKAEAQAAEIQKRINNALATKAGVEQFISDLNKQLSETDPGDTVLIAQLKQDIKDQKVKRDALSKEIKVLQEDVAYIRKTGVVQLGWRASAQKRIGSPLAEVLNKTDKTAVKVNVGSVKDAYFNDKAAFIKEVSPSIQNTPKYVSDAANLWAGGVANKGMIQNWSPPTFVGNDTSVKNAAPAGTLALLKNRHAFQFQYNPTYIDMSYQGMLMTDPMYEASGADKFNLAGAGVSQSTIAFQVMINRVYDMKYYRSTAYGGRLKEGVGDIYPIMPSIEDQAAIYKKGTMYDLEYLFRTLLGYTMPSQLRNEYTADMGFIGAMPVELHLGQGMRYLITVNSINVNHVLFNERMVPLFTTVDIQCNRLPDYAALRKELVPKAPKAATTDGTAAAPTPTPSPGPSPTPTTP